MKHGDISQLIKLGEIRTFNSVSWAFGHVFCKLLVLMLSMSLNHFFEIYLNFYVIQHYWIALTFFIHETSLYDKGFAGNTSEELTPHEFCKTALLYRHIVKCNLYRSLRHWNALVFLQSKTFSAFLSLEYAE